MRYLRQAVDHEAEVLESFVTKQRDKAAALKFTKKARRTRWVFGSAEPGNMIQPPPDLRSIGNGH